VKCFLTVTNPAVYRIDIHAHHPWLVVMQPLASECAEILYVIYMRIPVPPRPDGRAKLRSGAGGREILGSQDHRTVTFHRGTGALEAHCDTTKFLARPATLQATRMLRPEGSRATTRGWPRAGAFVADPAPPAAPACLVHARIALRIAPTSCLYARRQYGGTRPSMPAVVFR